MKQTEVEIKELKGHLAQMWSLVDQQERKSFDAVTTFDRGLAHKLISRG